MLYTIPCTGVFQKENVSDNVDSKVHPSYATSFTMLIVKLSKRAIFEDFLDIMFPGFVHQGARSVVLFGRRGSFCSSG